jgi:ATP-binding cassette subfamily B protein
MGTHAELIRARGHYYDLYTKQFRKQHETVYDGFGQLGPALATD